MDKQEFNMLTQDNHNKEKDIEIQPKMLKLKSMKKFQKALVLKVFLQTVNSLEMFLSFTQKW
jgi:hypothetical protein